MTHFIGVRPSSRSGSASHSTETSPSSRSAAAYGSSRCAATSSRTAFVESRRSGVQRRAQPLRDDRPDLRLGPARRAAALPVATGRAVAVQRGEQLRHAGAGRGGRDQDLGPLRPRADRRRRRPRGAVATSIARSWAAVRCGARLVALVDDDQVGDLEQAGLDRLDLVAHLGRLEHDRRVRRGRHLDLALARSRRSR